MVGGGPSPIAALRFAAKGLQCTARG